MKTLYETQIDNSLAMKDLTPKWGGRGGGIKPRNQSVRPHGETLPRRLLQVDRHVVQVVLRVLADQLAVLVAQFPPHLGRDPGP